MKYSEKDHTYKASKVTVNAKTFEARSYDWDIFAKVINGKLVWNSYNYSPSTIKHLYKVKRLFQELGLKPDLEIEAPKGLQRLDVAIEHYGNKNARLSAEISKPRTRKAKNRERKQEMWRNAKTIKAIRGLL